jgi:hypothetical protein
MQNIFGELNFQTLKENPDFKEDSVRFNANFNGKF